MTLSLQSGYLATTLFLTLLIYSCADPPKVTDRFKSPCPFVSPSVRKLPVNKLNRFSCPIFLSSYLIFERAFPVEWPKNLAWRLNPRSGGCIQCKCHNTVWRLCNSRFTSGDSGSLKNNGKTWVRKWTLFEVFHSPITESLVFIQWLNLFCYFFRFLDDPSVPKVYVKANFVLVEGQLVIGSSSQQYRQRAVIELTPNTAGNRGTLKYTFNPPADPQYPRELGHKAFAVVITPFTIILPFFSLSSPLLTHPHFIHSLPPLFSSIIPPFIGGRASWPPWSPRPSGNASLGEAQPVHQWRGW